MMHNTIEKAVLIGDGTDNAIKSKSCKFFEELK